MVWDTLRHPPRRPTHYRRIRRFFIDWRGTIRNGSENSFAGGNRENKLPSRGACTNADLEKSSTHQRL